MTTTAPEPAAADTRKSEPLQILIVDDEPEVAELIDDMLQYAGHRTMLAASGNEALTLLQQHGFDIILSDLQMPDLNGPALYARLQQQYPQMTGRIAFITGDALGARAGQFLQDSGCLYLEKPFTPAELATLIATLSTI
jgi:two-component system NtrC family sensor kinase